MRAPRLSDLDVTKSLSAASKSLSVFRQYNCIELVLAHLKINLPSATRYDELADNSLGMLFAARARYWIKLVRAAV
jgi:hypothetical protein